MLQRPALPTLLVTGCPLTLTADPVPLLRLAGAPSTKQATAGEIFGLFFLSFAA